MPGCLLAHRSIQLNSTTQRIHTPHPTIQYTDPQKTSVGVKVVVRVRKLLDHELSADGDPATTAQQQQRPCVLVEPVSAACPVPQQVGWGGRGYSV